VWDGSTVSEGPDYAAYQASLVANAKAAAMATYNAKISAGIQIVSTGTPALNGTYSIGVDPGTGADAKSVIDGIYGGIKGGDGLPGGGTTFVYHDVTGAGHTFDETSFTNFAKAVRDYLYALGRGQAPSLPVSIP